MSGKKEKKKKNKANKEPIITDLQLTMALILADKGISLESSHSKEVSREVVFEKDSIRVVERKRDSFKGLETDEGHTVEIHEDSGTILINSNSNRKEGIRSFDFCGCEELEWWEYHKKVDEMYQVMDDEVLYYKRELRSGSKVDTVVGEVRGGGYHKEEETATYSLPRGYKVANGIAVFKNMEPVDTISKTKKI